MDTARKLLSAGIAADRRLADVRAGGGFLSGKPLGVQSAGEASGEHTPVVAIIATSVKPSVALNAIDVATRIRNKCAMSVKWLREEIERTGTKQADLAHAMKISRDKLSKTIAGKRRLLADEAERAREYFAATNPNQPRDRILAAAGTIESGDDKLTPVVGYVGAGAEAHLFADGQGPFEWLPAPMGATDETVFVEIRGESLGPLFDRWLVAYDDVRRPVTTDLIGQLCVVGLSDGRILIKKLQRSRLPGMFNLISQMEEPILDVYVEWAALVKSMTPR